MTLTSSPLHVSMQRGSAGPDQPHTGVGTHAAGVAAGGQVLYYTLLCCTCFYSKQETQGAASRQPLHVMHGEAGCDNVCTCTHALLFGT